MDRLRDPILRDVLRHLDGCPTVTQAAMVRFRRGLLAADQALQIPPREPEVVAEIPQDSETRKPRKRELV